MDKIENADVMRPIFILKFGFVTFLTNNYYFIIFSSFLIKKSNEIEQEFIQSVVRSSFDLYTIRF